MRNTEITKTLDINYVLSFETEIVFRTRRMFMDSNARYEFADIKRELNSIISEIESISRGIRNDFTGIGSERCADVIDMALNQYYYVRRKLNNLDTSTVTEDYAQFHGGGSDGGRF